jgi:chromodomain-helicase-DNA-binding protein 4
LAATQREEILKAARDRDREIWRETHPALDESHAQEGQARRPHKDEPKKRPGLQFNQTTEFICGSCMKGGSCMHCMEVALEPDACLLTKASARLTPPRSDLERVTNAPGGTKDGDVTMMDGTIDPVPTISTAAADTDPVSGTPYELLFRCLTCRRLAHYAHLRNPNADDADSVQLAEYYQEITEWRCADCYSFIYGLDKILAWRPYPPSSTEHSWPAGEVPNVKNPLPREYLVKWTDRSYRRTQWVPHLWLASTHPGALRNFLVSGPKVELLPEPLLMDYGMEADGKRFSVEPTFEIGVGDARGSSEPDKTISTLPSDSCPDAERRIPPAWKTVDRVLDVLLWYPQKRALEQAAQRRKERKSRSKGKNNSKGKGGSHADSDEEEEFDDKNSDIEGEYLAAFKDGEQPSENLTETLEEYQARTGKEFGNPEIDVVVWAFFKWDDLGYDEGGYLFLNHDTLLKNYGIVSYMGFPSTARRAWLCSI